MERQRRQMRERLRERRQRRDESEYEAHAAIGMVMLAEQRLNARETKSKADASKQRSLVFLHGLLSKDCRPNSLLAD